MNLPDLKEWHKQHICKEFNNISWNESIKELHKAENIGQHSKIYYQRLAYDEIFSFFSNSEIRKKLKKLRNKKKYLMTLFKKYYF